MKWTWVVVCFLVVLVVCGWTALRRGSPEGFLGYTVYDALRDRGMGEQPVAFDRCLQKARYACSPRGNHPGSGGLCFSMAMSRCMQPHTGVDLPFYRTEWMD